jgi:hypothetical protein
MFVIKSIKILIQQSRKKNKKYTCSFVGFKNKKRARRGALTRNE